MSLFFRGCAQQMAICKALLKEGGTAPIVLAKLFASVVDDFKTSIDLISPHKSKIISSLFIHLRYHYDLSTSMCNFFFGKSFHENNEVGKAIGFYQRSAVSLN